MSLFNKRRTTDIVTHLLLTLSLLFRVDNRFSFPFRFAQKGTREGKAILHFVLLNKKHFLRAFSSVNESRR